MAELFSKEKLIEEIKNLSLEEATVKIYAWAESNTISKDAQMIQNLIEEKRKSFGSRKTYCVMCLSETMHHEVDDSMVCEDCDNPLCDGVLERDEQIDTLSYENKMMAEYLESQGLTKELISGICSGCAPEKDLECVDAEKDSFDKELLHAKLWFESKEVSCSIENHILSLNLDENDGMCVMVSNEEVSYRAELYACENNKEECELCEGCGKDGPISHMSDVMEMWICQSCEDARNE